jgi:hypothetical protein
LDCIPRFALAANAEIFMGCIKMVKAEDARTLIIAAYLATSAFIFKGAQLGFLSPRYDVSRFINIGFGFWSKLEGCFPTDF